MNDLQSKAQGCTKGAIPEMEAKGVLEFQGQSGLKTQTNKTNNEDFSHL